MRSGGTIYWLIEKQISSFIITQHFVSHLKERGVPSTHDNPIVASGDKFIAKEPFYLHSITHRADPCPTLRNNNDVRVCVLLTRGGGGEDCLTWTNICTGSGVREGNFLLADYSG